MITIPDRLLSDPFVTVFHRSPGAVMLKKQLNQSLPERSSYLAKHAFTWVTEGEQHIRAYDGETITLRAGDMGALRRGLYTVTDLVADQGHFTAFLLFLDDEQLARGFPPPGDDTPSYAAAFFRWSPPAYLSTFWRSVEELRATLPTPSTLFEMKVHELLTVLAAGEARRQLVNRVSSWNSAPVSNLRQFMEENYDKGLTVEDYAYLTGRSESTFRRDFKNRFGTTPRQWIIRRRLERAHHLLNTTDWEVTQVAEAVGYDNVSHFISAFKRKYQRTPRQKITLEQGFDRKAAS